MIRIKSLIRLSLTTFCQILFVSVNTVFLSNIVPLYIHIFITACLIGWLWTMNVRRIALGSRLDSVVYIVSSGLGSVVGKIVADYLKTLSL